MMLTNNTIVSQTDTSLLTLKAPDNNFTFSFLREAVKSVKEDHRVKKNCFMMYSRLFDSTFFSVSLSSCFDDDQ